MKGIIFFFFSFYVCLLIFSFHINILHYPPKRYFVISRNGTEGKQLEDANTNPVFILQINSDALGFDIPRTQEQLLSWGHNMIEEMVYVLIRAFFGENQNNWPSRRSLSDLASRKQDMAEIRTVVPRKRQIEKNQVYKRKLISSKQTFPQFSVESTIPLAMRSESLQLTRQDLSSMQLIGQLDYKFLLCVSNNVLICIDQVNTSIVFTY